jgi:hypothetical protein
MLERLFWIPGQAVGDVILDLVRSSAISRPLRLAPTSFGKQNLSMSAADQPDGRKCQRPGLADHVVTIRLSSVDTRNLRIIKRHLDKHHAGQRRSRRGAEIN